MKLTKPKYKDGIRTVVQSVFGGIDRREGARDGAIADAVNMSAEHYPVLSTRPRMSEYSDYRRIVEHFGLDRQDVATRLLCVCDVADVPYYVVVSVDELFEACVSAAIVTEDGSVAETVLYRDTHSSDDMCDFSPYEHIRAVAYNKSMIVFSQKMSGAVHYNESERRLESEIFESFFFEYDAMSWHSPDLTSTFVQARKDTIHADHLEPGDRIKLTDGDGAEYYTALKAKSVQRDYGGDEGVCLELEYLPQLKVSIHNISDIEHEYDSSTSYVGIRMEHPFPPAFEQVCVCRDRIWGTVGNEIYSSASCDERNWYRYDGTSADSFYAEIPEVARFTGVASYNGAAYFFTDEGVYRMYGTTPDAFSLVSISAYGLDESEARSFGVAGGMLIYNSKCGPAVLESSGAVLIGRELGASACRGAIGAGSGSRYYMCSGTQIYVYDVTSGIWHGYGVSRPILDVGVYGGRTVIFEDAFAEYTEGKDTEGRIGSEADELYSIVELGDITEGALLGVIPCEFIFCASLGRGSSVRLSISYDGGEWSEIYSTSEEGKHTHRVRFSPRVRAQHYRLRFDGVGEWKLYSLSRSYTACASTPYGE